MDNTVYVTGHKNPDTDSISATLAYSYLKKALGVNALPIRLGNINTETRYILERFGIKEPPLRYDIKPTVKDIDFDDPIIALPNEPIKDVWHKMLVNKKKAIAVVSEEGRLVGIASITDITTALLSLSIGNYDYLQNTPLENIVLSVDGVLSHNSGFYVSNGQVLIGNSVSEDYNEDDYHGRIVLTSGRIETQKRALASKAAVVIATGTGKVDPEIKELARKKDCNLIVTQADLITVTQSITQAIPVGLVMSDEIVTFNLYDYLADVKEVITKSRYRQYPIVDNNYRVLGMMSRFHLLNASRKQVILVDHNERSQSIEGVEEADIVEIIDHHRLGDITTDLPVFFRNEICGSSSTIVSELFEENKVVIPREYAGLLLSAIISDTMNFHSPTCTPKDIKQAKKLAKIAGEDMGELGSTILAISASLSTKTTSEIINNDVKEFNINSYKLAIGQVNIIGKSDLSAVKRQVMSYMESYCLANGFDIMMMVFSLIDGSGSYFLAVGKESQLIKKAFAEVLQDDDGMSYLADIVSRKQQIVPLLSKYLQTIKSN